MVFHDRNHTKAQLKMTPKKAAEKAIHRLKQNGFQALLAGGCVRDKILKRKAKDYDVATDAKPPQVRKLFRRTLHVGAKFGVVIVMLDNTQVEVATFRTDDEYTDGRHPRKIRFASPKQDAKRRDFTINGMFYDIQNAKIIDYVNGRKDLQSKTIRTIGPPHRRFNEDYLRMLRAVRFATQLNFRIEKKTWNAVCKNAKKITQISGERIDAELQQILINPNRAGGAEKLLECGLAYALFPNLQTKNAQNGIKVLENLPGKTSYPLALAAFFADCHRNPALKSIEILKPSRKRKDYIKALLENKGKLIKSLSLAQLKLLLAQPWFWDLYRLQRAIQKAHLGPRGGLAALKRLRKRINTLEDSELTPEPFLNGHQLIELGAVPGPALGKLAHQMYLEQLEGKIKTACQARKWVRHKLNQKKPQNSHSQKT